MPRETSLPDQSIHHTGYDGPWTVFLCEKTGQPMFVGYEACEFAEKRCPCGSAVVPVVVVPKGVVGCS